MSTSIAEPVGVILADSEEIVFSEMAAESREVAAD
jgi:hypothetical protein